MIRFLQGYIIRKELDSIVILVGGTGYEVFGTQEVVAKVSQGDEIEVVIYDHQTDHGRILFGMSSWEELDIFKLLIGVNGVGPKSALGLLDKGIDNVQSAIRESNEAFLASVPRLGKKTAQRIIIDLKEKVKMSVEANSSGLTQNIEVEEALKSLGYRTFEVQRVLKDLDSEKKTVENLIKEALQLLAK